jgi:hypothetical protein
MAGRIYIVGQWQAVIPLSANAERLLFFQSMSGLKSFSSLWDIPYRYLLCENIRLIIFFLGRLPSRLTFTASSTGPDARYLHVSFLLKMFFPAVKSSGTRFYRTYYLCKSLRYLVSLTNEWERISGRIQWSLYAQRPFFQQPFLFLCWILRGLSGGVSTASIQSGDCDPSESLLEKLL